MKKLELNSNQKDIIEDSTYPKLLKAGAGTGKTHVLLEKVIHILTNDKDSNLEKFAIITFTNKAADEMKSRLMESIYDKWVETNKSHLRNQLESYNMFDISTIHSFCDRIIRNYGIIKNISPNFKIMSFKEERLNTITRYVNKNNDNPLFKGIPQYKIVNLIIKFTNILKNKGIPIDEQFISKFEFTKENNKFFSDSKSLLIKICYCTEQDIIKAKKGKNVLEISDLIPSVCFLLKDKNVAKKISNQYEYVFIDEVQDTNLEQFELIQCMVNAGIKVFMIGDEKQSIYEFRGADVKNIDRVKKLAEASPEENGLSINYRTDPTLLKQINDIFACNFKFEKEKLTFPFQKLVPAKTKDIYQKPLRMEFGKDIVSTIQNIIFESEAYSKKLSYGDIAILCRRNYDVDTVAKQLRLAKIPAEAIGSTSYFNTIEIIDTFKLFNAIIYKSKINNEELKFTCYYRSLMQSSDNITFDEFIKNLDEIFRTLSVENILEYIYDKTHIIEYLRFKNQIQPIANLLKLKDKARALPNSEWTQPLQFLNYLNSMISSSKEEDEADVLSKELPNGIVSVYSIHKSKGLKFPVVIIPNCDLMINRNNVKPNIVFKNSNNLSYKFGINFEFINEDFKNIDRDYDILLSGEMKKQMEEELRILYVAMTRAEHMLILSNRKSFEQVSKSLYTPVISWTRWLLETGKFNIKN